MNTRLCLYKSLGVSESVYLCICLSLLGYVFILGPQCVFIYVCVPMCICVLCVCLPVPVSLHKGLCVSW